MLLAASTAAAKLACLAASRRLACNGQFEVRVLPMRRKAVEDNTLVSLPTPSVVLKVCRPLRLPVGLVLAPKGLQTNVAVMTSLTSVALLTRRTASTSTSVGHRPAAV